MKIEDLREKKRDLEFSDLAVGDVFKKAKPTYGNWTFMKIPTVVETFGTDDDWENFDDNAVCLEDGDLHWFDGNIKVIKVEAKLVIEKNEE